jgi:hypothetical protein
MLRGQRNSFRRAFRAATARDEGKLGYVLPVALLTLVLCAADDKPKLVVLDLTPQAGVEPQLASVLTDAVSSQVAARGFFDVTTSKDVQTLLGLERQKQLLGCHDEGSCLTELAGAIGARFVLSGQLARVGGTYQLTLQTLDTQKAQPVGRSMKLAKSFDALREQLPYAVADATGTPPPLPPSRVLPFTLIGVGVAAVIASAVVGLNAITQETQINQDLMSGSQLRSLSYYQQAQSNYGTQRTISLIGLCAGLVIGVLGIVLLQTVSAQ